MSADGWYTWECDYCRTTCTTSSLALLILYVDQHAADPCYEHEEAEA